MITVSNLKKSFDTIEALIGVVTQEIALYNELSAYDNLLFWGGMYKIQRKEFGF